MKKLSSRAKQILGILRGSVLDHVLMTSGRTRMVMRVVADGSVRGDWHTVGRDIFTACEREEKLTRARQRNGKEGSGK